MIKEAGLSSGEGAAPPPQCKQSIDSMFQSSSGSRRIKRCSRRARQKKINKAEKQRGNVSSAHTSLSQDSSTHTGFWVALLSFLGNTHAAYCNVSFLL